MKNMIKIMLAMMLLMLSAVVYAAPTSDCIELREVQFNRDTVFSGENFRVNLGDTVDIRVRLRSDCDLDNVQVTAEIVGYEYSHVQSLYTATRSFRMDEDDTVTQNLQLQLPIRMEKDAYNVRIMVRDRVYNYVDDSFTLRVAGPRTFIRIRDVLFSPTSDVVAGRLLVSQVRLENLGERDLRDVKIVATIPELGISDSKFVNERVRGSSTSRGDMTVTEELLLRVPACTKPGTYDVEFVVTYDEYESQTYTSAVRIVEGDGCPGTTVAPSTSQSIITPPASQEVAAGAAGTFPIVITNAGAQAEAYTISVSGVNGWGVAEVTDPAPIVAAGESKMVYVYVRVNEDATPGQKVFSVDVTRGAEKRSMPVTVDVSEPVQQPSDLRRILEISLIVLVILLVVLGIILAIKKIAQKDDNENEGQTYY
ncbi:MAG: hypothetical protein ACMXYC_02555 [Candidatus Woesearchaeota archaeon]